jgi:hypothetical protein
MDFENAEHPDGKLCRLTDVDLMMLQHCNCEISPRKIVG